ncbi:MAG: hypothetical protein KDB53_10215, partial [Planctomycetes bacterium]|nr:hypothetical protein [Planctomycetota bacterium]
TAIVIDGLTAWLEGLERDDQARAKAAIDRALAWLENWSRGTAGQIDPFNAPYALSTLIRYQRREAAAQTVRRIVETQREDGNWSVYGPARPASFNTAQCVMALAEAQSAKVEVPKGTFQRGILALQSMRQTGGLFPYSTAAGHDWMTTDHGSISRDPLCENALFAAGRGDESSLEAALRRFLQHYEELRLPTKKLYDYFNSRGHGGYFFFYALRNAKEAARHAKPDLRAQVLSRVRTAALAAREGDGSFMDHHMIGRAYSTAMALYILAD